MEHTSTHRTPKTKFTGSRLTCGKTLWTGKKGGEGSQRSSVSSALIPSVLIFSRLWMASQPGCWEWPYRGRSYIPGDGLFPPSQLASSAHWQPLLCFLFPKFCHFRNVGSVRLDRMRSFQFALFPQCDSPWSHLVVAHVIVGLFFFLAVYYSVVWTACSLIVHPLERIWVISTFGVFWIKLLYTRMNILM